MCESSGRPTCAICRGAVETLRLDCSRSVPRRKHGGHPECVVVVRRRTRRPGRFARQLMVIARQIAHSGCVQHSKAPEERTDRRAIRSVPRLTHGRLPATAEALPGSASEGLGQQLIQERAKDELRGIRPYGVPDGRTRGRTRWQPAIDLPFHRRERRLPLFWQKPPDRRTERDGRRVGDGEPVELVLGETCHAIEELGDDVLRPPRWRWAPPPRRRPALAWSARPGRSTGSASDPSLAVVTGTQLRNAQPVMGNVDPLRLIEAVLSGDVRVMSTQEGPPGDLDRFGGSVRRQFEPCIQVVVGQREAG